MSESLGTLRFMFFHWQEMLLELSQVVQAFLYANNKPPPQSFYEEMMSNKKKQEEKQREEHRKRLEFLKKKEAKEVSHCVNKHMQEIYCNNMAVEMAYVQMKNYDIFLSFAQNIDCR